MTGARRLRGHAGAVAKPSRYCRLCESGRFEFHVHCMVCCGPLEVMTARKTCPGDCQRIFKMQRRKARSVKVWVQPLDESSPRRECWLPKRLIAATDTGVSGPRKGKR